MASIQAWLEGLSERAGLMRRMMASQGIDLTQASQASLGTTISAAARSCMLCPENVRCRAFLDGAPEPGFETPARFCSNAYVFAALARSRA